MKVFIFFTDGHQHCVKFDQSHKTGTSDTIFSSLFPSFGKDTTVNNGEIFRHY